MQVESLRLGPHIALHSPGAPYYAILSTFSGSLGPHRNHDYAEITAIVAGEGRLVTYSEGEDARVEVLLPGQMYFFRPIDVHELIGTGPDGLTIANVAFSTTDWQTFSQLAAIDPGLMTVRIPPSSSFHPADPHALEPHRRAIARAWDDATNVDLIEFWVAVLHRFSPRTDSRVAAGAPAWLLAGIDGMRDERNLRAGLPRLVDLCHVSPAHLWRTTRRYCGMTPAALVAQMQLRHATALIGTTSESIASIGERSGFTSASYFSKAFRRVHSLTPREYRARAYNVSQATHRLRDAAD